MNDFDFLSYVTRFDFACLLETFITENLSLDIFKNFTQHCCPAVSLSKAGRKSGGVLLLVRKELDNMVKKIDCDIHNILILKLSKHLFKTVTDVFLICAYIAPVHSPLYAVSHFENGISALESCMLQVTEQYGDVPFIICGDFNARTGTTQPCHVNDINYFIETHEEACYMDSDTRNSQDNGQNYYGQLFLELGAQFDLFLINGTTEGDRIGNFTFISSSGCSVIDYFAISRSNVHLIEDMFVDERIDSQHMPIVLTLTCNNVKRESKEKCYTIQKLIWNPEYCDRFKQNLLQPDIVTAMEKANEMINQNVNISINIFNNAMKQVSCCMLKQLKFGYNKQKWTWFDKECKETKLIVKRALRNMRINRTKDSIGKYIELKKEYSALLKLKSDLYKTYLRNKLMNATKDLTSFWSALRSVRCRLRNGVVDIPKDNWQRHFFSVFEAKTKWVTYQKISGKDIFSVSLKQLSSHEYLLGIMMTLRESMKTQTKLLLTQL